MSQTNDKTPSFVGPINKYIAGLVEVLQHLEVAEIDAYFQALHRAWQQGRTIYIFGNGGSASTASHTCCDVNKGLSYGRDQRWRMISLNDNVATMMAYANDVSYEDIFVEQLKNFLEPGDVVVGISSSGNSENVVRAVEWAREQGALTVALCGYDGGRLKAAAEMAVHVRSNDTQKVEDVHMMLSHMFMQACY